MSVTYVSYKSLPESEQKRWVQNVNQNLQLRNVPAATFAPAVYANAMEVAGLEECIRKVLPVMMNAFDEEARLREKGLLSLSVPLSFREMARKTSVADILKSYKPLGVAINPDDGVAVLKKGSAG